MCCFSEGLSKSYNSVMVESILLLIYLLNLPINNYVKCRLYSVCSKDDVTFSSCV